MSAQLSLLDAPTPAVANGPKIYRFLYRCGGKGCTATFRVSLEGRQVTKYRRRFVGVPGSAEPYKAWEPIWPGLEIYCVKHRWPMGCAMIKGTFSEKHVCDVRCITARGHNCECSCGGENHGRAYEV